MVDWKKAISEHSYAACQAAVRGTIEPVQANFRKMKVAALKPNNTSLLEEVEALGHLCQKVAKNSDSQARSRANVPLQEKRDEILAMIAMLK